MEQFSIAARPGRREYSKEFKAEMLAKCQEPGANIGGVAITHGLHPRRTVLDKFLDWSIIGRIRTS